MKKQGRMAVTASQTTLCLREARSSSLRERYILELKLIHPLVSVQGTSLVPREEEWDERERKRAKESMKADEREIISRKVPQEDKGKRIWYLKRN